MLLFKILITITCITYLLFLNNAKFFIPSYILWGSLFINESKPIIHVLLALYLLCVKLQPEYLILFNIIGCNFIWFIPDNYEFYIFALISGVVLLIPAILN